MSAGRLGHRIYLAASSFGLGCCGIGAFYDNEAAALLELREASVMLYLVAVGPVKRILTTRISNT
jgi:nitroreductase